MYNLSAMTDFFNGFDLHSILLPSILVVGLLLALLLISQSPLPQKFKNWRINRILNSIGVEQIRHFSFPDGLGGQYVADRLALCEEEILIISYRPYRGQIYCAEKIDEWTQVVDRKSFKFENPLFDQNNQVASLSLLIRNTPIEGHIIYSQEVSFPKGKPDRVHIVTDIPGKYHRDRIGAISSEVQAAWDKLKATRHHSDAGKVLALKT